MKRVCTLACLALLALTVGAPAAFSEPIKIAAVQQAGKVNFEKQVLPVLRKKCLACHNSSDAESDLILETPEAILKGGSLGPAVVPGKSAESLLLKVASAFVPIPLVVTV